MNTVDIIINILIACALLCGIGFAVSDFFMRIYMYKRQLFPAWRLMTGFFFHWELLGKYRKSTREEFGHAGIWFKLSIMFASLFILTGVFLAGITIFKGGAVSWPVILIVALSAFFASAFNSFFFLQYFQGILLIRIMYSGIRLPLENTLPQILVTNEGGMVSVFLFKFDLCDPSPRDAHNSEFIGAMKNNLSASGHALQLR